MASSLFPPKGKANNLNQMMGLIQGIQNPANFAQNLMNQNPNFRQFVEQNKNKSVDQIAKENGIDLSQFAGILNRK